MANPYELWDTRRSLGVFRDIKPDFEYWLGLFGNQINSEDEYIDFEKLPLEGRKLAAFVMPLARGKSVYDDRATLTRFKPAYIKVEDAIDPLMPLTRRAGIDSSVIEPITITPMQRIDLIRTAMTGAAVRSIRRTWDWMASKAIIDAAITLSGEDYPTTLVDFARAGNHTIVLSGGSRFGDTGVSIVDFFQFVIDRMTNAEFGAMPVRATMGGGVWAIIRRDPEFLKHLDTQVKGGNIVIERGLVGGDKVFRVGSMSIGGQSGAQIELWVNNDTYKHPTTDVDTRYLANTDIVFTGSPEAIKGFRCFGRIIDRAAEYAPVEIFPKNWLSVGDVQVEYLTHKSAPLMVPVNPNATLKATVIA